MIFLRRNSNTLPHGFPSLSETFQLVRTLCQVSPDGDSLTPSDWPVTGPLAGPLRSVEGLPSRNIQLERKKNTAVCRYPQTHSFWRLAGILPFTAQPKAYAVIRRSGDAWTARLSTRCRSLDAKSRHCPC